MILGEKSQWWAAFMMMVLSACGGGTPGGSVQRADSVGVEIVTSNSQDVRLGWQINRQFSIGGDDEGLATFTHVGPGYVGTDDRGRIYVLDALANRVVMFALDGTALGSLGRKGEGPGELGMPASLAVSGEGTVSVFDYGKAGLVRFGPDGDVLRENPFPFYPWPGTSRHIGATNDGMLVATMIPSGEEDTFRHALQLVTGTDTVVLAEHSFPRAEMAMYRSCGGGLNLPRIFEPQVTWAVEGKEVVVARGAEYDLEVLEAGHVVRRVRMDLAPRLANEGSAVAELGEGFRINFGRGMCTIPPEEMVEKRGYAEAIPWIDLVSLSPSGEIWIRRKEVGSTDGPIDVFDSTGAYQGSFPAGSPFPVVFLGANRFGAAEVEEFDVSRLVVYEIVR